MIILNDDFNEVIISRHRNVLNAFKAKTRHLRALKRRNGQNCYVWYSIEDEDGADITEELERAELYYLCDGL